MSRDGANSGKANGDGGGDTDSDQEREEKETVDFHLNLSKLEEVEADGETYRFAHNHRNSKDWATEILVEADAEYQVNGRIQGQVEKKTVDARITSPHPIRIIYPRRISMERGIIPMMLAADKLLGAFPDLEVEFAGELVEGSTVGRVFVTGIVLIHMRSELTSARMISGIFGRPTIRQISP